MKPRTKTNWPKNQKSCWNKLKWSIRCMLNYQNSSFMFVANKANIQSDEEHLEHSDNLAELFGGSLLLAWFLAKRGYSRFVVFESQLVKIFLDGYHTVDWLRTLNQRPRNTNTCCGKNLKIHLKKDLWSFKTQFAKMIHTWYKYAFIIMHKSYNNAWMYMYLTKPRNFPVTSRDVNCWKVECSM